MSVSLQRNLGSTQARNAGGTKNYALANAYFQIVQGVVPIMGFGLFTLSTRFNSTSYWDASYGAYSPNPGVVFTDIWPNVFTTLTESLSRGGNTSTRSVTWTQNLDIGFVQTVSDPNGWFGSYGLLSPSSGGSLSGGGTTFSQTWTDISGTWTYTATVSSQLTASTGWATWAAQATALANDFAFPAWNDATYYGLVSPLPGTSGLWTVFPQSTTPFYTLYSGLGSLGSSWPSPNLYSILAAANGIAIRSVTPGFNPPNAPTSFGGQQLPASGAYVQDEPSPAYVAGTTPDGNSGYVVSLKSRWQILGLSTSYPPLPDANNPHLVGTWGQPMTVPSGAVPYFTASYSPAFSSGLGIASFAPTDVTNMGIQYGMIGFRHP